MLIKLSSQRTERRCKYMDARGSCVGTMDVELFINTLFKLLDIQNDTETKVTIKKVTATNSDSKK